MPVTPAPEYAAPQPFWGLAGFPVLGGVSAALVEQNLAIGAVAYYGLLAAALASPQAAPLRRALFDRSRRRAAIATRPTPQRPEPREPTPPSLMLSCPAPANDAV